MNQNQKKFILKVVIILLTLISIGLLITFIISVVNKHTLLSIISGVFTLISPTTLIGIIIKYFMNQNHLKNINELINPTPTKPTNTNTKEYIFENIKFKEYKKDNKIVITFPSERVENSIVSRAFLEYLEAKRKEQV